MTRMETFLTANLSVSLYLAYRLDQERERADFLHLSILKALEIANASEVITTVGVQYGENFEVLDAEIETTYNGEDIVDHLRNTLYYHDRGLFDIYDKELDE